MCQATNPSPINRHCFLGNHVSQSGPSGSLGVSVGRCALRSSSRWGPPLCRAKKRNLPRKESNMELLKALFRICQFKIAGGIEMAIYN